MKIFYHTYIWISYYYNCFIKFGTQGYLMKKGFLLPTLRYFWFVLRPGELTYYKDPHQKEPSGLILLNANCWADSLSNNGKLDRRFVLSTPEHRCIELVAEDHKGRLQWLAALQTAIQHSNEKIGYQRSLANQRRSLRQVKFAKNQKILIILIRIYFQTVLLLF